MSLQEQIQKYEDLCKTNPKGLPIENYSLDTKKEIFNLKKRKNLEIGFRNAHGWYCKVDYAYIQKDKDTKEPTDVTIVWHFEKNPEEKHKVSLERFIEIYRNKEFFNITPREFYDYYFITNEKKLKNLKQQLELNE